MMNLDAASLPTALSASVHVSAAAGVTLPDVPANFRRYVAAPRWRGVVMFPRCRRVRSLDDRSLSRPQALHQPLQSPTLHFDDVAVGNRVLQ